MCRPPPGNPVLSGARQIPTAVSGGFRVAFSACAFAIHSAGVTAAGATKTPQREAFFARRTVPSHRPTVPGWAPQNSNSCRGKCPNHDTPCPRPKPSGSTSTTHAILRKTYTAYGLLGNLEVGRVPGIPDRPKFDRCEGIESGPGVHLGKETCIHSWGWNHSRSGHAPGEIGCRLSDDRIFTPRRQYAWSQRKTSPSHLGSWNTGSDPFLSQSGGLGNPQASHPL